ncbi:RNA polymerase sigma factor [Ornithinibacillus salinisoli]|uniref:RNA polymerase sigma factor n=1 Tax=Ornithinibacillus salinisoli TaxID=1848459 RepID=A0ABW4VWM2_9BACI
MFERIIEKYRQDLTNYCKMLTGTPWDAEDLFQETMIKTFDHKDKLLHHPNPKAYMFRVASTTWIDFCRKRKVDLDIDEKKVMELSTEDADPTVLHEVIEDFASSLPPKQAVVILLMDVFKYTSRETAEMINSTISAVKSTLHRGRKNIQNRHRKIVRESTPLELIKAFQEAMKDNDPTLISIAYKNIINNGFQIHFNRNKNWFTIHDPEGNRIGIIHS